MSKNAYARRKHDAARATYSDGRAADDRDVRTTAGRGLLYSEDYPPGADRFRCMRDAILAIEDEAAATERRLTMERVREVLAYAFERARYPDDPKAVVIPTGVTTMLSSEVPAFRKRQADAVMDFIEQSGVARSILQEGDDLATADVDEEPKP